MTNDITPLVVPRDDGEPTTTSMVIAEGTGNQHKNVLGLIRTNILDFEEFGRVAFETRPLETAGGTQSIVVADLNEPQATLLMTYLRNNDVVRAFKKRLVRAFYEMRQRSNSPQIMTRDELLSRAVLEATNVIQELRPKADKFDRFLTADGDWSVSEAAGIIQRAGVIIGEQRLFDFLYEKRWTFRQKGKKWRAAQYAKERGWLAEKPQGEWTNPETGETHVRTPQTRVTPKGIDRLVEMLTDGRTA